MYVIPEVYSGMALFAEGNQVLVGVIAEFASGAQVMDVKIGRSAAVLAAPSISF
jgi:hypothetical protein